jgi:uncharacterized protein
MTITMYAASVPLFRQMLNSMNHVLAKAEAHAEAKKIEQQVFLQARLAPDMFALVRQVQIACDFAKGACGRLAGVELPTYEDTEQSFAELTARINKTLAFIDGLPANQIDGSEAREIVLRPGTPKEKKFHGQQYLLNFAIPQFLFHVTTTYAILRHNGVEIGKGDFMGAY